MKVLITGADGFVGQHLVTKLNISGFKLTLATRANLGDFTPTMDWSKLLIDIDIIIHLAARVHIMNDTSIGEQEKYDYINFEVTRSLAKAAAIANVKKFIFLSSIKVNGEGKESAYVETDFFNPQDPYAKSKWKAELSLVELSNEFPKTQFITLRPPLIYGPNVKANFLKFSNAIKKRIPLPIKGVTGKRSFLYIGNLVDVVLHIIKSERTHSATYLVSDGENATTDELAEIISGIHNLKNLNFRLPGSLLKLLLTLIGKKAFYIRLTTPLMIDSSKIRNELKWKPPYTLQEGLRKTFISSNQES